VERARSEAFVLGGNVFGWSADEEQSVDILDKFVSGGGSMVDTADHYSSWLPGHVGGESEAIIGAWMQSRGNRDSVHVTTKGGMLASAKGLSIANLTTAAEASLTRLRTDRIDLYYAHIDDPDTSLGEAVEALNTLVQSGKVLEVGLSNYTPERLAAFLEVAVTVGLPVAAYQTEYNLVARERFETDYRPLLLEHDIAAFSYYSLAMGFLSGKYRSTDERVDSVRARGAARYLDERGVAVLTALDDIAAAHGTNIAAVSLAWLNQQPGVAAPVASARTLEQLAELQGASGLVLDGAEVERLIAASA
jgi:aryl-alcohol dehydrogenase-like predicted oxidoreductase